MTARIKLRRDTATGWSAANPVLALGEPGLDTTTGRLKLGDGVTAWTALPFATGTVLASVAYNPASTASYGTSSTSFVDVDATNLAVTFTAPVSGAVIITLSALLTPPAGPAAHYWALREATTVVASRWMAGLGTNGAMDLGVACELKVTGLTPGSAHTYKWAQRVASGTGTTYAGGTIGPALMKVVAA